MIRVHRSLLFVIYMLHVSLQMIHGFISIYLCNEKMNIFDIIIIVKKNDKNNNSSLINLEV